jgi:hypothetical protein
MDKVIADRINMTMMRWIAAASFLLLVIWSLAGGAASQ